MAYNPPQGFQSPPSIHYHNSININYIVNAQVEDTTRVGSFFSYLSKGLGSFWPGQSQPDETTQTQLLEEINDNFKSKCDILPSYTPPASEPSTPTKRPLAKQTTVQSLDKRPSPQSQIPQTPQRPTKHALGLPTPESSPQPLYRCQATAAAHGAQCKNSASQDHDNLVCIKHKGQHAAILGERGKRSLSDSPSLNKSGSNVVTPVKPKRPSVGNYSPFKQGVSPSEGTQAALPLRSIPVQSRRCSETKSRHLADIPAAKTRKPPRKYEDGNLRSKGLRNEFVPNHLTHETQESICNALMGAPSATEGTGYIYSFEDQVLNSNTFFWLKVGRSEIEKKRFKDWKGLKCNTDPPILKFELKVSHYVLVEHLVHLHLADLQRNAPHLRLDLEEDWVTGRSIVQPCPPYSDEYPRRHAGILCKRCHKIHMELFRIELHPREAEEYAEDTEERAERESLIVELVQRIVEYWAEVALRVRSEISPL